MITRIIDWSISNRFLIFVGTVLLIAWGVYSLRNIPLDAIPDLSDVQVIVKTTYPGQAPQVVEDQVTYPITTVLRGVTGAVSVRGYSMYGDSYVYVVFRDGTDPYWARSRVLELLNQVSSSLPALARPELGPDATGVGWVYQYALVDRTGKHDLSDLRSLQDWFLKYELQSLSGVSEVATVGGMVKQYQVVIDPEILRAYQLPLTSLTQVIKRANGEQGAGALEMAEARYMIRVAGYLNGIEDLRNVPISPQDTFSTAFSMENPAELLSARTQYLDRLMTSRTVYRLGDVADVRLGPQMREGIAELNGEGEVVGGIVLMRPGSNALDTIAGIKTRLGELKQSLPEGVELVEVYDRSGLIHRAIDTLTHRLVEEFIIIALVCALFLWHIRSSLVVILSLPIGILAAFGVMQSQGISANIMSLGGIAIAIGAMVDAAIVMIENLHKHLERDPSNASNHWELVRRATSEVGPALFLSLIIITLSFLPVLVLQGEEGRLFAPLAFTKTYAMAAAAMLSITLVPVLLGYMVRGHVPKERDNIINRGLIAAYRPLIRGVMRYPRFVLILALALTIAGVWPALRLGSEFMPNLDEGDLLYMPTTFPGISPDKAREVLQQTDRIIRTVPEVASVFGKVGRAETATDPAPMEMIETTIRLKPWDQWRSGMTIDGIKAELEDKVKFPGLTNSWLMPINARLQMLSTGIKTPVGIKISGPDLDGIQELGRQIEEALADLPGTRSVFAERVSSGRYIEITPDRWAMGKVGLTVTDTQEIIASAVGGMNLTEVINGRERYPVNLRFTPDTRDSVVKLKNLPLVTDNRGGQVPLEDVARIEVVDGPNMIRTEDARLNGWVFIDIKNQDIGSYIDDAKQRISQQVSIPAGYSITWSGEYEHWERAKQRLMLVVPLTLLVILVLLYINFHSVTGSLIILSTLPLGLVGGFWLMYLLDYHLSVAAAIGFIALGGVAVEIGVVMMLYLDRALSKRRESISEKSELTRNDVKEAIIEGALLRLRPVTMTKVAIIAALLPIMLGTGSGSEAMQRIAAPMVGGMLSVAILTLAVIPAAYLIWKAHGLQK